MRKFSVGVTHYWSKTINAKYGGEAQLLIVELLITSLMLAITLYCYVIPELGIFFAGFIIPTIIFCIGTLTTIYHMIAYRFEQRTKRKNKS
ncbi:hypothetical protein [Teredinibacter haidensis]|uniref:hypothetical protein n=1 Tax=Teredinibacter haidensis TaxID=2731755 RepID=UPI000949030C|nr:hypothetical protein [Teredinibacter haidensis]